MFYYSETKYLHEVKNGVVVGGIKGFAKITFREERGTVSLHIDAKGGGQPGEAEMILYGASENETLHRIAKQKSEIKRESAQFSLHLGQLPFPGEECWFGCLIHVGDKWYGEEGEYLKEMFSETVDREQTSLPAGENEGEKPAVERETLIEQERMEQKLTEWKPDEQEQTGRKAMEQKPTEQEWVEQKPMQQETEETPVKQEGTEEEETKREETGECGRVEKTEAFGREEELSIGEKAKEELPTGKRQGEAERQEKIEGATYSGIEKGIPQNTPDKEEQAFWKTFYLTDLKRLGEKNRQWERYAQNSFLLHGFYNYKHLITTEQLLGVPGNYYDKERQVAAMFGFHGFLPVKELEQFLSGETVYTDRQITPGTFGYYFEEEKNLDSLDAPQGNRGKVRYTGRRKGF